eukprot:gene32611-36818_t
MSSVSPRSLRSRGFASNEASPMPTVSAKKQSKPKKKDRSPTLQMIPESPMSVSSTVLSATNKRPRGQPKQSNWPEQAESADVNSPEHSLAASFYGAAPFRGVNILPPNPNTAASPTTTTVPEIQTVVAVPAAVASEISIDYANYDSISQGLAQLAEMHNIPELTDFVNHYTSCSYYASLDDYEQAWNYSTALYAFIARKCCDLPNITNKQRNKETKAVKAGKEDKPDYKEGDKIVWDVADQVFSVCVPCFEAATSFEKCKRPSEDVGAVACYDAYLGRPVMVKRVN